MPAHPTANAVDKAADSSNTGYVEPGAFNKGSEAGQEHHRFKEVKVYVTGYGSFRGITKNPSFEIIKSFIPESQIYLHPSESYTIKITLLPHPTAVRVAYADVNSAVRELYNTADFDYILHVGVGLTGGYELEKIAHGDGYMVGDVDGLLPNGGKAKDDETLTKEGVLWHWGGGGSGQSSGDWIGTGLDVDWMVKMIEDGKVKFGDAKGNAVGIAAFIDETDAAGKESGIGGKVKSIKQKGDNRALRTAKQKRAENSGYKIKASTDAGRYLCEYIYRKSLEEAITRQRRGTRKPWNWNHAEANSEWHQHEMDNMSKRVLFMHVPPVGNPYSIDNGIECLKQVVALMVMDGEGLRLGADTNRS
ncbi:hypothetical protein BDZ91DRAFT_715303 [Kalaharituber pfeilii]|nr:hypothetical protein BDZ91DRAFT_715303 [Kalaharituber pfeilii]